MADRPAWLMPLAQRTDFYFAPGPRDFIVEEIPLYPFSGAGEHLIVRVRKKNMTTWEMVQIFSEYLGIRQREIGYAGLKDKHAVTTQYLSLPARYEPALARLNHPQIKILTTTRHRNKLRIGHLKGNRFSLRFKKILGAQKTKLDAVLDWIEAYGVPNYFGMQRFGIDGDNWQAGQAIANGKRRERDRRTRTFLLSAYQSKQFNDWLSRRIAISRLLAAFRPAEAEQAAGLPAGTLNGTAHQQHFFKILEGDVMMHYPHGRIFPAEDLAAEAEKFYRRDRAPTGPIFGTKMEGAPGAAGIIEAPFAAAIPENGSRRYAWVWPEEIGHTYLPEQAHYALNFVLPKGAYATNVVDVLRGGAAE